MRSRKKIALIVLVAAVLASVVAMRVSGPPRHAGHADQAALYYCPMHPTYTSDRPGDCPICNMKLVKKEVENKKEEEKKILYWTDPMMPGYKSDKPGKSPMGMEMIPVYKEGAVSSDGPQGYSAVLLSDQKKQLIGLKTVPAGKRVMVRTIRTVGRIAYDPELYQTEQEYLQASAALEKAKGMGPAMAEQAQQLVDSARLRLRVLGLSESAIREMAGWKEPDRTLLLPDGNGQVWLYAPVYEYELSLIRVGQKVQADTAALPGRIFEGSVQSIDSVLDPMSRSARVRAVLKDPQGVLRPEMYVDVSLRADLGERLAVPQEAVLDTGIRRVLFVEKSEGVLEPREVEVGLRADSYVEILKGVQEGESVVINGNFLVDSESRLKSALEGAGQGHQHGQ